MNQTCGEAQTEENEQRKNGQDVGSDKWASANYCIDSNGTIGLMIEEKYRALTSSNNNNDRQAVTIEVVNCAGKEEGYPVTDKAYEALIKLCADICKRNGIKKLNYTGDSSGNLTRHDFFNKGKDCPGAYLGARFPEIASRVNDILELNGDGLIFEPRLSLTETEAKSLKYYNSNPFGAVGTGLTDGYGMPNCTAYAWGRWWELFDKYSNGTKPTELSTGNAEDWFPHNKNLSTEKQYPYSSEPKLGSILCYNDPSIRANGNEAGGHVAIVEKITKTADGVTQIETSNSGYGRSDLFFYRRTGTASNGWGKTSDSYEFQGFIHLPFTFQERLGGTPPKDIDVYIWNFLYAYLRDPVIVAGIMGNLYQESLLNPYNLQDSGNTYYNGMTDAAYTAQVDAGRISKESFIGDGFGYGLAQWTWNTYKKHLYNFKNNPKSFYMEFDASTGGLRNPASVSGEHLKACSIGDLDMQLNFLIRWLWQGSSTTTGDSLNSSPSTWWTSLKSKKTPEDAAEYFCNEIESPNPSHANLSGRKSYALRYYNKFTSLEMSTNFNNFGVYNWMCGLAEDYTPPSTYVEPKCKKCGLPISQCKCYFLKYENNIVEEYAQPYSEKLTSLYSPKGIVLYYTDKKIEKCLYNTGATLPNTLPDPIMTTPYNIPFHFLIGMGQYEDRTTYKTIQTFSPKKVLNKSGTGKWGTLESEYIHVLVCADATNNTKTITSPDKNNPKDVMGFIRHCVNLKLIASNTVPSDMQTDIIKAGDENLYGTDEEGSFINEICEGVAFIYKNYINKDYDAKSTVTLKNGMEMLSLISINEAYQYQLASVDKTFFFPQPFGDEIYSQNYNDQKSLYYKIDYNQWFSEPVQTKTLVLSTGNSNTAPVGIYNMYGQVIHKGKGKLAIPPYIDLTESQSGAVKWADGTELKTEDYGNYYQKALSVTSDIQDGYFIIGPKLDIGQDNKPILLNTDVTPVPKTSFIKGDAKTATVQPKQENTTT